MAEYGLVCRCPTCETTFRVTETQLSAAHGAVRCGACLQVFAANDHQVEPGPSVVEAEVAEQSENLQADRDLEPSALEFTDAGNSAAEAPLDKTGFDSGSGPARPVETETKAKESNEGGIELTTSRAVSQAITEFDGNRSDKTTNTEEAIRSESEPVARSAEGLDGDAIVQTLDGSSVAMLDQEQTSLGAIPEIQLESVEPDEIVGEYEEITKPQVVKWFVGALLLGLVLAGQIAWVNIDRLVQDPKLRNYYALFCNYAACQVPAFEDVSSIETTELVVRVHPEVERALLVDAIIKNTSAYRQPFPSLEMKFTDLNNLVIATRKFLPSEYLGGEMAGLRFIPALTEVRLGLEIVDPGENAFGYALEAVPDI